MKLTGTFNRLDPFHFESQLSEKERSTMHKARDFAQRFLAPTVNEAFREQSLFIEAAKNMGEHHLLGGDIDAQYGGPNHSAVEYGLIMREMERVDTGYRTLLSVISGLVMHAIYSLGSEEQKKKYLPKLACGELIGSFALTEPEHGSDTAGLETSAKKVEGGYILNGKKRWIGLAPYADILIIWAKDSDKVTRGFIVPRKTNGVETARIEGKISLRTVPQGEIILKDVHITEDALLPKSIGLKSAFGCLNHARYAVAWGALGSAEDCFERALNYSIAREQFGRPLAANQLIQKKLVDMSIEIAFCRQACLQVARCIDAGTATLEMISMIKRDCAKKALIIAHQARDILGGNGIVDEYGVMRHLVNLEAANTHEGTEDIHTLILGRAITGIGAFAN